MINMSLANMLNKHDEAEKFAEKIISKVDVSAYKAAALLELGHVQRVRGAIFSFITFSPNLLNFKATRKKRSNRTKKRERILPVTILNRAFISERLPLNVWLSLIQRRIYKLNDRQWLYFIPLLPH